jgi:hypothetical protein
MYDQFNEEKREQKLDFFLSIPLRMDISGGNN